MKKRGNPLMPINPDLLDKYIEASVTRNVEMQAEAWVLETFGPADQYKRFSWSQMNTAWMAGFAAGLSYAIAEMRQSKLPEAKE
jgi:hypothetical protein